MDRATFKLDLRPRWVNGLVENVQEYFRRETGVEYRREIVERSLAEWLESRLDQVIEGAGASLTAPHLKAAAEFRQILESNAMAARAVAPAKQSFEADPVEGPVESLDRPKVPRAVPLPEPSIFTGKRSFDPTRLSSMVAYIVDKGHDIYKTNLNKLLFYSDMTAYALRGQGISGATYVNMPFGPVPEHIEAVVEALVSAGTLSRRDVPEVGKNAVRFELTGESAAAELSEEDRRVLDWVLSTYGEMGAGELSELSHKERAYKDTRPLEPIAYEYAKFLKKLPDIIDN